MSKLTDEKIAAMCPKCREAARDWIVEGTERIQQIVRMSNQIEILAFACGAATMLMVLVVIAACQR